MTNKVALKVALVTGIGRRSSLFNTARIDHLAPDRHLVLHYGDMTDTSNPDALGTLRLLEAIRMLGMERGAPAGGAAPEPPQSAVPVGPIGLLPWHGIPRRMCGLAFAEYHGENAMECSR